jgi:hypothetical protein
LFVRNDGRLAEVENWAHQKFGPEIAEDEHVSDTDTTQAARKKRQRKAKNMRYQTLTLYENEYGGNFQKINQLHHSLLHSVPPSETTFVVKDSATLLAIVRDGEKRNYKQKLQNFLGADYHETWEEWWPRLQKGSTLENGEMFDIDEL